MIYINIYIVTELAQLLTDFIRLSQAFNTFDFPLLPLFPK